MKIRLLTYEYPPFKGGIAAYLSNLVNAAPAGVEVVVDVPKAGEHWIITAWRQYFKIRKEKPDLIAVSHVLPAGYIAFKINFWLKVPYLVFTHGTDILSARKRSWKRFWMRFILRRAKYVIANSRYTASLLREEGITRVEIIPPAVPTNLTTTSDVLSSPIKEIGVRSTSGLSLNKERGHEIISVGRLVPRKGFDVLIKAMPAVIKITPDAHLTIIGRGEYYDELVRLAHELRVEAFVDILTDIEDKTEYWHKASLFVLAAREDGSDIEGFGIVTLEASSMGLPVVVGRSGGAPEAVIDGVTGLIVAPNDPTALAKAIIFIMTNEARAQRMGEAGRKFVAEEYSVPMVAKRFWSIVIPKRTEGSQSH